MFFEQQVVDRVAEAVVDMFPAVQVDTPALVCRCPDDR